MGLNARQEAFCKQFVILGNASMAYIQAGYSAKDANKRSSKLRNQSKIIARIDELMKQKDAELIAKGDEILQYLTSVMRGESQSTVTVVEGVGDGESRARNLLKAPDEKERLRAAELIGKRYSLFTDNHTVDVLLPVIMDNVGT